MSFIGSSFFSTGKRPLSPFALLPCICVDCACVRILTEFADIDDCGLVWRDALKTEKIGGGDSEGNCNKEA